MRYYFFRVLLSDGTNRDMFIEAENTLKAELTVYDILPSALIYYISCQPISKYSFDRRLNPYA